MSTSLRGSASAAIAAWCATVVVTRYGDDTGLVVSAVAGAVTQDDAPPYTGLALAGELEAGLALAGEPETGFSGVSALRGSTATAAAAVGFASSVSYSSVAWRMGLAGLAPPGFSSTGLSTALASAAMAIAWAMLLLPACKLLA